MHYKTIVLELIHQRPQIYEKLRSTRQLLPTLNLFAQRLKTSHEAWKGLLSRVTPDRDQSQISAEAMEYALQALEGHFEVDFPPEENKSFLVEDLMAFVLARRALG